MINASDSLGARVLTVDDQEANVRMLLGVLSEARRSAFSSRRMAWRLPKHGSAVQPSARLECLLSGAAIEGSTGSNRSSSSGRSALEQSFGRRKTIGFG